MPLGIALVTIGAILLKAGWLNESVVDVVLGRDRRRDKGNVTAPTSDFATGVFGGGSFPTKSHAGTGMVDGHPVAFWIIPYLKWAHNHGWSGKVTSGWRSTGEQKRIYDSGVRPAAKPGESNHEGTVFPRGAVDVSDPNGLEAALRKFPGPVALRRDPAIHDPVHFSATGR